MSSLRHRTVVFVSMLFVAVPSLSQTLQVRVLDAKSGKPLAGQNITIVWSGFFDSTILHLGKDGSGQLIVRAGQPTFKMVPGPKPGNEPYRIAYGDCNDSATVQVEEVMTTGVVPKNKCSTRTIQSRPNQVIFWGLPTRWWQPDFQ